MRRRTSLCFALALLGSVTVSAVAQRGNALTANSSGESTAGSLDAPVKAPALKGDKAKKAKLPKPHPVSIVNGAFTVDGWTSEAHLNYDISDLKYIFLSVPSVGTVIVSQLPFADAVEQQGAFNGQTLTVDAGGHHLQLSSDKQLLHGKVNTAWVKIDSSFTANLQRPIVGYGSNLSAPYEWPPITSEKVSGTRNAPPLPKNMRPQSPTGCAAPARSCVAQAAPVISPAL